MPKQKNRHYTNLDEVLLDMWITNKIDYYFQNKIRTGYIDSECMEYEHRYIIKFDVIKECKDNNRLNNFIPLCCWSGF